MNAPRKMITGSTCSAKATPSGAPTFTSGPKTKFVPLSV